MAYTPAPSTAEVNKSSEPVTPPPVKAEVKKPAPKIYKVVKYKTIRKKYKVNGKTHYRKARAAYVYRYKRSGRGGGDCWTNSANLYGRLTASGQKARIIQYASSLSPRHRSVQVYSNGGWVNYDYKGNGYAQTYHATSGSSHGTVVS